MHGSVICFTYIPGALAIRASHTLFGQGSGYILLDGVNCVGTEDKLDNCSAATSISFECTHNSDAGVRCLERTGMVLEICSIAVNFLPIIISGCTEGDLRLEGTNSNLAGRLEVCYDGVWGTVCQDHWGRAEASVACRRLGFSSSCKHNM